MTANPTVAASGVVHPSFVTHNPDVLTCIANLSNDEVFTPPAFANQMLDTLADRWANANNGASIWADPTVTFLDPFTKSGVFLREITRRLTDGLVDEITDLKSRVDHILTKQVYGIAITRLTALLARRSVYCSKFANGKHSIASSFATEDGNVWFERTEHSWNDGKCKHCGASEAAFTRDKELETHAYAFIHTDDIQARIGELFGGNMQFDVIIGNPPYQLEDGGGGTSAVPIYQHFVEQAKALEPRYMTMVIPSRWFTGGKGLDDFRKSMLADDRIRVIDDYLSAADVFPGVGLKGGICAFLWDRDHPGQAEVRTSFKGWETSVAVRPLLEPGAEVFIRFNQGVAILKKVMEKETGGSGTLDLPVDKKFMEVVSVRRPFGLASTYRGKATRNGDDLEIYQRGGRAYVPRSDLTAGDDLIDAWKLLVGFAAPGTGNRDTYPHKVISTPFVAPPGAVSTETYLAIGPFASEGEAGSALSYLQCRLTRFLIQLHKASQNTTRGVYRFVPMQDWSKDWTDELLYEQYGISDEEQRFIESVVRPMELDG